MKLKYKLFLILFSVALFGAQLALTQPANAALSKQKQKECFEKYDGFRTTTNNKKAKEYANSNCPSSKGGNCKANSGSSGAVISCTNPDKKNNDNNKNNSSGTEFETNIGDEYNPDDCKGEYEDLDDSNCEVFSTIKDVTNVLAGVAGVVIVGVMIAGGIRYSMAGADPAKVQAAKQMIINAILALVLFAFGYSIVQWLIPGGLF